MIAGATLLLLTALGAYGQSASFATITGHAQDLNGAVGARSDGDGDKRRNRNDTADANDLGRHLPF